MTVYVFISPGFTVSVFLSIYVYTGRHFLFSKSEKIVSLTKKKKHKIKRPF